VTAPGFKVSGKVADTTGEALPGASIKLDGTPAATGETDGSFVLADVAPGEHTLVIEAPGREPAVRGVHVGDRDVSLAQAIPLGDALGDTVVTTPHALRPIDIDAGPGEPAGGDEPDPAPQPTATPNKKAVQARECYEIGDEPPPGYRLVPDLATPLVGLARDHGGKVHIHWNTVTQQPVPADAAAQYLEVRYDLQYYRRGRDGHPGSWCELFTTDGTAIPLDPSYTGFLFRVAPYARRESELVYGGWTYFMAPRRQS
jgi:hypothetical protein